MWGGGEEKQHHGKWEGNMEGLTEEEAIALAIEMSTEEEHRAHHKEDVSKGVGTQSYQLPFRANEYANHLRKGFGALLQDPIGSDVVIQLKPSGFNLHCHSVVLSVFRCGSV